MLAMACDTESCSKPFTSPMKSSFFLAAVCACAEPQTPKVVNTDASNIHFFIEDRKSRRVGKEGRSRWAPAPSKNGHASCLSVWISDVCPSDLPGRRLRLRRAANAESRQHRCEQYPFLHR